jgi:polysaccharide pyruvyl transferase WcaK-like protein
MAFNLTATDPGEKLGDEIRRWISDQSNHPLIGLNVSGLIALDPDQARSRFGLRASYLEALVAFIETVLSDSDLRLLLVPHVMTPLGTPGSDADACLRLLDQLPSNASSRVRVTPTELDEREVKWLISQVGWFCGTRMHSTIAALSSRVPTAAIAYSDKTRGVFKSCGLEDQVIDPRQLDTQDVVDRLIDAFGRREQNRQVLSTTIPGVKTRAAEQFTQITDSLKALG